MERTTVISKGKLSGETAGGQEELQRVERRGQSQTDP